MQTSRASVTIQATPEIRVRVNTPSVEVSVQQDPAHIVVLAASTVAGPKGDPGEDTADILEEHINAEEPHPAYDNGPDLTLLYENAKV